MSTARDTLRGIAWQAMRERGFEPDYPPAAVAQVNRASESTAEALHRLVETLG